MMLSFLFEPKPNDIKLMVNAAQNGDCDARESLITANQVFIKRIVSKHSFSIDPVESRDEYSIGLIAFNEAIDSYRSNLRSFHSFAAEIIKKRLIDYYRSQRRFKTKEIASDIPLARVVSETVAFSENNNIESEMKSFLEKLARYGITLNDLVSDTPKHLDSRQLCANIAQEITSDPEMSNHLLRYKTIPVSVLLKKIRLNPKTVWRNRKYIIALCLVLLSDLEVMKGYINQLSTRR